MDRSRTDDRPTATSSRSSVKDAGDLVAELLSISADGRVGGRGCRGYFNLSDHGLRCNLVCTMAANAPAQILGELSPLDIREVFVVSVPDQSRRAWETIRSQTPIPSDRFVLAPHWGTIVGAEDIEEFIASLDHWRSGPAFTRFWAELGALKALSLCAEADAAVDQLLRRFEDFVHTLQSDRASRLVADLKGFIATQRKDWASAAKWYGQYVRAGHGQLRTVFDLSAAWQYLTVRSLDSEPFEPSGPELRDLWQFYRDQRHDGYAWGGATATAVALQRLGKDLLADRFATWAMRDTLGVTEHLGFATRLKIAGLPVTHIDQEDKLDTLIDELFAIADELDANAQIDSP